MSISDRDIRYQRRTEQAEQRWKTTQQELQRNPATSVRELEVEIEEMEEQLEHQPRPPNPQKSLREYAIPTYDANQGSVRRPAVEANNFEIKPAIITMIRTSIQFSGLATEDPHTHIANFLEICDTFKSNGVSSDAVQLRLFPFSLNGQAKSWLQSLPPGSITTWDELTSKFLAKFFPPSRTAKLRNDITNFTQLDGESLYEAWERYKEMLRKCLNHNLPVWLQVQTFYNGLTNNIRTYVDAAAGGAFMSKSDTDAYKLLEEMSSNNMTWANERSNPRKPAGVHDIDTVAMLNAKLDLLMKRFESTSVNSVHLICEMCGEGHSTQDCQRGNPFAPNDQANFVGNFPRPNNPYSSTYNPGWRNHPNFSWSNNGQAPGNLQGQQDLRQPHGFQVQGPSTASEQTRLSRLEEAMLTLTTNTTAFMQETKQQLNSHSAAIKNIEVQIGQLANHLTQRPQGSLPSNTMTNLKEQVHAITLRSGKEIQGVNEVPKAEKNEDIGVIANSQPFPIQVEKEVAKGVQGHPKPQEQSQEEQSQEEQSGELVLRIENEEVKFKGSSLKMHPTDVFECSYIDMVETENKYSEMDGMAASLNLSLKEAKDGKHKTVLCGRMFLATPFEVG